MNILILVTGQSRLITQCWQWQEQAYKEVLERLPNVTIDIQYGLWDKSWDVQLNPNDILKTLFTLSSDFKIYADIFPQDKIMQTSYDDYTKWFEPAFDEPYKSIGELEGFTKVYGQLKCRDLAINKIRNDYDIVLMTRSDVIFDTERLYNAIYQIAVKNKPLLRTRANIKEYFIFCEYIEYRNYMGIATSDQVFISTPKALKLWFSEFDTKFKSFIYQAKKIDPTTIVKFDPHAVSASWAYDPTKIKNNSDNRLFTFTEFSTMAGLSTILRPQLVDTIEAKTPNADNLHKLNILGKPYIGAAVNTAKMPKVY